MLYTSIKTSAEKLPWPPKQQCPNVEQSAEMPATPPDRAWIKCSCCTFNEDKPFSRGTVIVRTGKTSVLPWFFGIERGSGSGVARLWYAGLCTTYLLKTLGGAPKFSSLWDFSRQKACFFRHWAEYAKTNQTELIFREIVSACYGYCIKLQHYMTKKISKVELQFWWFCEFSV